MMSLLKPIALTALVMAFSLSVSLASRPASALSTEDSAGNPDVTAPLTDPDDATDTQAGGFTMTVPNQDGSSGLQWGFGSQTMPSTDGDDGQSQ